MILLLCMIVLCVFVFVGIVFSQLFARTSTVAGLCTLVTNLISTFEPDPELDSCAGSAAAAASHAAMAAEASAAARGAALTAAAAFEVRLCAVQRVQL